MAKLTKPVLIAVVALPLVFAVGVAAVLVGAAIYGHKQASIAGNEAAAALNIKSISFAQVKYSTEHGYFGTFDQLVQTDLLSQRFAGTKPIVDGYVYDLKVSPAGAGQRSTFTVNADPESPSTGIRHFFIDDKSSIVHVNRNGPASALDPPHVK